MEKPFLLEIDENVLSSKKLGTQITHIGVLYALPRVQGGQQY